MPNRNDVISERMEYRVSRFPMPAHFFHDRKRKKFLAFARNDTREKVTPHHLSHHHIELCLCEVLYPAPL
jgi:hypothetical protein